MINKAIREKIDEHTAQTETACEVLESPSFDNSIVGITNDGRLVYNYEKMVAEFMKDEHCSREEAIDFIEYNTIRDLAYRGSSISPIIIYDL